MEIPYTALKPDALHGIIEEFINREGTDYGMVESTMDKKVQQVIAQLKRGMRASSLIPSPRAATS